MLATPQTTEGVPGLSQDRGYGDTAVAATILKKEKREQLRFNNRIAGYNNASSFSLGKSHRLSSLLTPISRGITTTTTTIKNNKKAKGVKYTT